MPRSPVQFEEYSLDCERYELLRAGRPVKLEKIPMELLILLVDKDGRLVTRQEIVEQLWGKDVFVDTEHGINTAVRKIRMALKDDPEKPRFVQTVTGKGYRFVSRHIKGNSSGISALNPAPQPDVSTSSATEERIPKAQSALAAPKAHRSPAIRRWGFGVVSAIVVVALLFALNVRGWRERIWPRPKRPQIQSLAVLPLENLSGDPSQEYFADGMTDELITMLAKNAQLRVISRTSVMQYKGAKRPLRDIAQELGVDGILEGSVEHTGTRVHLNVQLIHARSDIHLWAESYDRDLSDVFSLQTDLADRIAQQVGLAVIPSSKPQRRLNPQAYDAYFLGRYYWFTSDDITKSQKYFQRAIDLQPDYAAAWSGLADSYSASGVEGDMAPEQVMPQAEAATKKALELDDSLAEAHNSMAAIYLFYRWNWQLAERESARAIELNPNFAEAHHLRGYVLRALNRNDEDLQEQRKCLELDPVARPWVVGYSLIRMRNFDAALGEARVRLGAQPNNPDLSALLSDVYWLMGRQAESVKEWERTRLLEQKPAAAAALRTAFERGGSAAVIRWELGEFHKMAARRYISPLEFANDYGRLKLTEETIHYLELAYKAHTPNLVFIQSDPTYDFLHSDSRYRDLVTKIGLPPTS